VDDSDLRIGEVARAAGVRKSLIRYYEAIGLIPPAPRVSGQRRYDPSVLRRLAMIDVAQRAGLTLDEIRQLLEIGSDPFSPRLRALAERRLPEIERLIARATQMRAWLETATRCECVTVDECALFDEPALPGKGLVSGAVPGEPETAVALGAAQRGEGRDHLAGHQAAVARHLVDDGERRGDPLRRVDDNRDDRDMSAQLDELVAMRRVGAVEAPDAAQRGRARRA
jgi:MerR family transcriptional regulator, redox-sensitive transcriptional activator SoxR